jgi:hypothetical protein
MPVIIHNFVISICSTQFDVVLFFPELHHVSAVQRSTSIAPHGRKLKTTRYRQIGPSSFFVKHAIDRGSHEAGLPGKSEGTSARMNTTGGFYDDQAETRFFTEFKRDPTTRNAKIDAGFIAFNGEATRTRHDGCQRLRTAHATKAAC